MKYLPLIWAGLWRKRARTVLTLLCVVVAFALFGLLHGFTAAIDGIIEQMSDTRLRTMSRVNITQPLPLAHRARMQAVPGVEEVSYYNFFAGYYQDRSNGVQVGAIDVASFNVVYPDIQMDPKYVDAMLHTRNGALVGEDLAAERGWKIGDRIPLGSAVWTRKDGAEAWDFEIVGSYRSPSGKVPTNELWINYDYFDEARAAANGTVTLYFEKNSRLEPLGGDRGADRRAVRQFDLRNANAEREGLAARADCADRRHRVLRQRHHRRRDVRAAVRHR